MLRMPHCLDIPPIDGGKVVSLMNPPHFIPQKHYNFNVSGILLQSMLSHTVRGTFMAGTILRTRKVIFFLGLQLFLITVMR
jgi:hypothetical protein